MPSPLPTSEPSPIPSAVPTPIPSSVPTSPPTLAPTVTLVPTSYPTTPGCNLLSAEPFTCGDRVVGDNLRSQDVAGLPSPDALFIVHVNSSSTIEFDSCTVGTDFATHISIWTGCPLNNGTLLVNQTGPEVNTESRVAPRGVDGYVPTCSIVRILVDPAPADLYVVVSGLGAAPKGQFAINTTCLQEPTFSPTLSPSAGGCQFVPSGCGHIAGSFADLGDLNNVGGPDVNYLLKFSEETILTVSVCDGEGSSDDDILVGLYDGCVSDSGQLIGAASNASANADLLFGLSTDPYNNSNPVTCSFLAVVPAGDYWLMVEGLVPSASGNFNVSVQCGSQTEIPTQVPTSHPTPAPSPIPSTMPSLAPSPVPSLSPTPLPSPAPTPQPTPVRTSIAVFFSKIYSSCIYFVTE